MIKRRKKIAAFILSGILAGVIAATSTPVSASTSNITLSKSKITLAPNQSTTVTIKTKGKYVFQKIKSVKYSKKNIATVTRKKNKVTIKGKKTGTVKITLVASYKVKKITKNKNLTLNVKVKKLAGLYNKGKFTSWKDLVSNKKVKLQKKNTISSAESISGELIIPNSVTSIGEEAFSNCYELTNITIPNSVTSIEKFAFSDSGLTSITIPNSVSSIGDGTFHNCLELTSITIPNSVSYIGEGAFFGCSNLKTVYYNGTEEQWKKITISVANSWLEDATIIYKES